MSVEQELKAMENRLSDIEYRLTVMEAHKQAFVRIGMSGGRTALVKRSKIVAVIPSDEGDKSQVKMEDGSIINSDDATDILLMELTDELDPDFVEGTRCSIVKGKLGR